MVDVDIPRDEIVDPPALRAGPDFPWYDRSRCRTPMQWTAGPNAGFTTGRPWIRLAPGRGHAERRRRAAGSRTPSLAAYRRLLAFRRTAPALRPGGMERLDDRRRRTCWPGPARRGDQRLLTVVSFVGEPRTVDIGRMTGSAGWTARVGTHREPSPPDAAGRLALRADEAVILEAAGDG